MDFNIGLLHRHVSDTTNQLCNFALPGIEFGHVVPPLRLKGGGTESKAHPTVKLDDICISVNSADGSNLWRSENRRQGKNRGANCGYS